MLFVAIDAMGPLYYYSPASQVKEALEQAGPRACRRSARRVIKSER